MPIMKSINVFNFIFFFYSLSLSLSLLVIGELEFFFLCGDVEDEVETGILKKHTHRKKLLRHTAYFLSSIIHSSSSRKKKCIFVGCFLLLTKIKIFM